MKILIYIEPHPIRGSWLEFLPIARKFVGLHLACREREATEVRIVANKSVSDALIAEFPEAHDMVRPISDLALRQLMRFDRDWDEAAVADWLDLVDGTGGSLDIQQDVLHSILSTYRADLVVIWSENGAVRQVCNALGIPVLHCELGPTRFPFQETVYCDLAGTNGNAALREVARQALEDGWTGAVDPVPGPGVDWPEMPPGRYAFIPLQFADDLNTRRHSRFSSPRAFLEEALPRIADTGASVVLKGHPGARQRPYNHARQQAAIMWAKEWADRQKVRLHEVPASAGFARTAAAVVGAECTVTINSSLGFESLLLRTPSVLFGNSVYDADGLLQSSIRLGSEMSGDGWRLARNLISLHCQRLLIPSRRFWQSTLFYDLCAKAVEAPTAAAFSRSVCETLQAEGESGWSSAFAARGLGAATEIRADRLTRPLWNNRLFGFIEKIQQLRIGNRLSGWAIDRSTGRPPGRVLAVVAGRIVADTVPALHRPEAAAAFPGTSRYAGFELLIPAECDTDAVTLVYVGEDGTAVADPPGPLRWLGHKWRWCRVAILSGAGLRRLAARR